MKSPKNLHDLFKDLNLSQDPTSVIGNRVAGRKVLELYKAEIRTFSISEHARIVHRWCNMAYSKKFWNMESSYLDFVKVCLKKVKSLTEISYMLFLNDTPVACFEIYMVSMDVLADHFEAGPDDYGIHLLLAPYREMIDKLGPLKEDFSVIVLRLIIGYLFEKTCLKNLLAEPDRKNINACRLAERAGFKLLKEIALPDKCAKLYCISRDEYLSSENRTSALPLN